MVVLAIISVITNSSIVEMVTDVMADAVFLLIPPAINRDNMEHSIDSIIHKNNIFTPLKYSSNPR